LTAINIPASVKTIGEESFKGCTNLKEIILPNSLTSIGFRAFFNCTGLKTFSIPASVTSIGSEAFRNCSGLESIYAFSANPIDLSKSSAVFDGVNKTTCILYVPFGSKPAYQVADQWKDFLNIIEMPGLKLSADSVRLDGDQGSSSTIDLISNTNWSINHTANWLTINTVSGNGNQKLTFTADKNISGAVREGTIKIYTNEPTPYLYLSVIQDTFNVNESNFMISISDQAWNTDSVIEIPVITSELKLADNIISYQFKLNYDTNILKYVDRILDNTISAKESIVVNSNKPGLLQISFMSTVPLFGAGELLILKFKPVSFGDAEVILSEFYYNATKVKSISNGTITITENIPPTAAITISDTDGKVKPGDIITITATFNESMADTPVPQILMGGAVTLPATNMTKVTDVVYTYTHTVGNGNGEVNITMATGTDITGNIVTTTPTEGGVFLVDNINPEVTVTYSDPDLKVRAGDEIVITATFSEPVSEGSVPVITLNGANTLPATALNKISSTQFSFNYTVKNGNGNISVSITNAADEVGNMLIESTDNAIQVIGFRYGDVDDNGIVQAYDAALALQYSVGLDPLKLKDPLPWESWRILAADVDNVEGITANDASLILQYSADLITSFPVENSEKNALVTNDDIMVSAEEGFLVFRSLGNLYGLNITLNNSNNCLGSPVLSNQNMISAVNISDSFYAVGVASASSIKNGEVIMKIPFKCSPESGFSLNLIINSTKKQVNVDLTTGVGQLQENKLSFFPNPAHDVIHIKGTVCYRITILDINGKTVYDEPYTESKINIGNLKTGLYLIKAETDDGIISERFVKR